MKERLLNIHKLRKEGKTFSQIGKIFGFSKSNASYLYLKAERLVKEKNENPFKFSLSVRTKNCLINYFNDNSIYYDPQRIAETGYAKLSRTKNMGHKSLIELSQKLQEFGYIKDADRWIEKGVKKLREERKK